MIQWIGHFDGIEVPPFFRRVEADGAHVLPITHRDCLAVTQTVAGEHPEKVNYSPEEDDVLLAQAAATALGGVFCDRRETGCSAIGR